MDDVQYMVTVNAGNIDKDWAHVTTSTAHIKDARWRNASEGTGLIAVLGPGRVFRSVEEAVRRIGPDTKASN